MKGSLAKGKSGELVEDELKRLRKAQIEQAARQKSIIRVVEKSGVITIGIVRQDIARKKANKVLVANQTFVQMQKAAPQAVVGL